MSGSVLDRAGKYSVKFTASDGHHPTVSKSMKLTIRPGALATLIGRRVHVKHGSITVRCRVAHGSIKNCAATALRNGKSAGSGTARLRHRGSRTITVTIKLNKATRQAISRARRGVTLAIHLAAHKFGSKRQAAVRGGDDRPQVVGVSPPAPGGRTRCAGAFRRRCVR